ncbi:MAG: 50S ribosomal protein L25 [Firmicutes bacterium]|nr:50S ribosomal protein L25 [Bacillota bacterium]
MEAVLKATVREETGKGAAHRLRQAGKIPAVIYGERQTNICVDAREALKFFNTNGYSQLLTLRLDNDGKTEDLPVLVKEAQFDPIKGTPLHLDFHQVSMRQKVVVKVPVVLVGEEKRVNDGSVLETTLYELEVSCLPADIPAKIEVDISGLTMNNSITVADLQAPAGVEFVTPAHETVVVAFAPRVEVEQAAPEETPSQEQPEE